MKIWTGKFCRFTTKDLTSTPLRRLFLGALSVAMLASCASKEHKTGHASPEDEAEVSLKGDRKAIEELRKDIPEETKKTNDRLAEMLNRWRQQKMAPDNLREHFTEEIRKLRVAIESKHGRMREDFQRGQTDRRKEFQDKQKDEREKLFSNKPTSEKRQTFMERQSEDRDRFNSDQRASRDDFEETIRDERKAFEDDIANRWSEFRGEFPEYSRIWREMNEKEEKDREERLAHPKPYTEWPYKTADDKPTTPTGAGTGVTNSPAPTDPTKGNPLEDVNKGGNGWPSSDPSEFNQLPKNPDEN